MELYNHEREQVRNRAKLLEILKKRGLLSNTKRKKLDDKGKSGKQKRKERA